ncbi:glucose-1-phosphate thymidylyltransferase [Elusimicrobiota bacterium]
MFDPAVFFNTENAIFTGLFENTQYVWEGLAGILKYITDNIKPNIADIITEGNLIKETVTLPNSAMIYAGAYLSGPNIQIGSGTVIEPSAYIREPAIIGNNSEIRQAAYIRGSVVIGDGCVVGHATEMKNSVMLGESKAGHFAYIGDSILGKVNLGAGTKLANLKVTESKIHISAEGQKYTTGLRKFGAILADNVETGCNSVTSPGTILSKNCILYPNTTARGYYPANTIIKLRQNIEKGEFN